MLTACLSAQFELLYSSAAPDQVSSLVTSEIEQVRRLQRGRAVSGALRFDARHDSFVWFGFGEQIRRALVFVWTETGEVT